jgi:membrane protease subunit HflK
MAHEHEHKHEHESIDPSQPSETPQRQGEELDAAGKSLSDALRISFAILKVIMVILVVAFLASGFKTVGPDEQALVLRFGKIRGVGEEMILGPGWHWIFPYPIDELVKIPVGQKISLAINTFWYKETRDDVLPGGVRPKRPPPEKLDPLQEGYCLTGSQRRPVGAPGGAGATVRGVGAFGSQRLQGNEGSDYNIVHTRWQIDYQITGVEQFFRNVYVQDVRPGQVYVDVITQSITLLLKSVVEDAIVDAIVQYSIDEAILSADTIRRHVMRLVQEKLDAIESGVYVTLVQLVEARWPKQVDEAFNAYVQASQQSSQALSEARTYADKTLTNAAGRVAEQLYQTIQGENADEEQQEALWALAAGEVQDRLAQAQTYRTKVVEAAKANADYLTSILPEYRKRPELVLRQIYLDAIQEVLTNADEKFVLDKSDDAREQEFRILVNRDPALKSKETK